MHYTQWPRPPVYPKQRHRAASTSLRIGGGRVASRCRWFSCAKRQCLGYHVVEALGMDSRRGRNWRWLDGSLNDAFAMPGIEVSGVFVGAGEESLGVERTA